MVYRSRTRIVKTEGSWWIQENAYLALYPLPDYLAATLVVRSSPTTLLSCTALSVGVHTHHAAGVCLRVVYLVTSVFGPYSTSD